MGGIVIKRICLTFVFALVLTLSISPVAYANMAAPKEADIGSSITFEQNDKISVLSEVLDITVDGSEANIVATYKMKNITDESISTKSMFLSPNMNHSGVTVVVNGKNISFVAESYVLNYATEIKTDDWQYAVLASEEVVAHNEKQTVDAITFEINFMSNEEYDVVVSYTYRLGGYPDYDFNAKEGRIEYYLTPAAMWNDFGGITINLSLDEGMPVISSSSLEFKKISTRTYQYISDTLPEENLEIVIDENWWQNIFSSLRSPYLSMTLMMFSPLILIAVVVVILIVLHLCKKKKHRS